jgi:ribulose-phosphate 3-epimerase
LAGSHIKIAPSILSADFAQLGKQVEEAERAGADCLHLDVMDGVFVPNISFGPMVVKAVRTCTKLPLNAHLMVVKPEKWIGEFVKAGANSITVHVEACGDLPATLRAIKAAGVKAGVSLNPDTPLSAIKSVLPLADEVLVMLVNPGFGGQALIPSTLEKVRATRQILDARDLQVELAADGGINAQTAASVVRAGATLLVAGSAVFNKKESVADALLRLRTIVDGARRSMRASG